MRLFFFLLLTLSSATGLSSPATTTPQEGAASDILNKFLQQEVKTVDAKPVARIQPEVNQEALAAAKAMIESIGLADRVFESLEKLVDNIKPQAKSGGKLLFEGTEDDTARIKEIFLSDTSKAQLIEALAITYALQFTADEIEDIEEFYQTPTGQKFIGLQLNVSQNMNQIIQLFANRGLQYALSKWIKEKSEELKEANE